MDVPIVYEDENILAVNKPAGLIVHADGKTSAETLVDWVVRKYPDMETVGEPLTLSSGDIIHRAGIVHRLDKDTSGILVIAKNQKTFEELKRQFMEREIEKEYRAIVYGALKKKEGRISMPIGRSVADFRRKTTLSGARGKQKEAVTDYRVEKISPDFSYISVFPKTGRTHQIRVHLKAIGYPIVCDSLYAPKHPCPPDMGRLALHAHTLLLRTQNGATLLLEAPIPDDFKRALKSFFPNMPRG